jgi:hypothetical protein
VKGYRDKGGGVMRAATFIAGKVPGNIKFWGKEISQTILSVLQVMVGWRELTVHNAIGSEKEVIVRGMFNYTTKEKIS